MIPCADYAQLLKTLCLIHLIGHATSPLTARLGWHDSTEETLRGLWSYLERNVKFKTNSEISDARFIRSSCDRGESANLRRAQKVIKTTSERVTV